MRFGISETSWMLPKILRMRFDAVGLVSIAGAVAAFAMEIFLACLSRRRPGSEKSHALQTQKAADLPSENRSFSVYDTPADQCVERAARRRALFRKTVVRGAI